MSKQDQQPLLQPLQPQQYQQLPQQYQYHSFQEQPTQPLQAVQPQQYQSYQIPPNSVAPLVVCQTAKYRLKGSLYSGFSSEFPTELSNVLAPSDFSYVVRDINDAAKYKKGLRTTLLVTFILSSISFFFVFIPYLFIYVIVFPVSILLMAIAFFSLVKIQSTITKKVQAVVDNFNKIFSSNSITMELVSGRTKHIHIIYPIYFNVQPAIQTFQTIQQQSQPQYPQQVEISKNNANENSSLLV
ncbi:hypothetical protein ACTFIU_000607 [Dictyostelium citrinum]